MRLYRYLLAALFYALPTAAFAQCAGVLPAGYFCGNASSAGRLAAGVSPTAMFNRAFGAVNNAVLATNGSAVPAFTTTLPNAVQDNITRLGTVTSGALSGVGITGGTASGVAISGGTVSGAAVSGGTVTGLSNPTVPSDAATKSYVDAIASGLNVLGPSRLATAAVLPNTPTYSNGASGVGATLTAGSNTTLTVDGTTAALNDIILVKNQVSSFQNGQYYVSAVGSGAAPWVLTRCTAAACGVQFNTAATMLKGSYTFVTAGSTNIYNSYTLAATVSTVGTDPASFNLFSFSTSPWVISGSDVYRSSGKVGIGSAGTPLYSLDSRGSGALAATIHVGNGGDIGAYMQSHSSNDLASFSGGANYDGTNFVAKSTSGAFMQMSGGSTVFYGNTGLTTSGTFTPTERMRIGVDGGVAIGTSTTSSARLRVDGAASTDGVVVNQGTTCCGPDGIAIQGNIGSVSLGLRNTSTGGKNWHLLSYGVGTGIAGTLGLFNDTAGINGGLFIDATGNVSLTGSSSPIFSANSAKFFLVNNATAHGISEVGTSGNASSAGDVIGTFSFVNSSLGTTDKRVGIIDAITLGATNTAYMNFGTYNAGTYGKNLSLLPWGQTNISGTFGINAPFQTGTDITSALQTALATYDYVKLPCGTFIISTIPVQFGRAGQTLDGGGCATLKNSSTATDAILNVLDKADVTIRDITVDGDNKGLNNCLNFQGSVRGALINFKCLRAPNAGVQFMQDGSSNGSHYGRIDGLYMEDVALSTFNGHPVECSFSDYMSITNVVMNNVDNGFNLANCQQGSLTNFTVKGSGVSTGSFAGVRIVDDSNGWAVSGGSIIGTPRGLMLAAANNNAISGISIWNVLYEAIYFQASNSCGAPCGPTQGNTLGAIAIKNPCITSCGAALPQHAAILFEDVSGANYSTNNTVFGVNLIDGVGHVNRLFGLNGQAAGTNRCDVTITTISGGITYGSC